MWRSVDEFSYTAYNIIDLISKLGGSAVILFNAFSLFPLYYYNVKIANKKFINKLFFIDKLKMENSLKRQNTIAVERFDLIRLNSTDLSKEEKQ